MMRSVIRYRSDVIIVPRRVVACSVRQEGGVFLRVWNPRNHLELRPTWHQVLCLKSSLESCGKGGVGLTAVELRTMVPYP